MIKITYKKRCQESSASYLLEPQNYYDQIEPGESFESDGVPRFNRLCYYVSVDETELEWVEAIVSDINGLTRTVERYAPDGRFSMWQRTDPDGSGEICVITQIDAKRWHIARMTITATGECEPNYIDIIEDLYNAAHCKERFFPLSGKAQTPPN
jgi:hypothetical protein